MNNLEKIKKKIKDKKLVIGTGITFSDSSITELLGNIGFDYIWIETEHSSLDKKDTQLHIIAAKASGVAAFVRIPWNDFVLAKPVLDMGPSAIIFPFIKTAKDAEAVKNLDEILEVEGVDAIIVGPCDLSGSVGLLGQTEHYEVKKLIDIISKKALNSGKPFGVSVGYNPKTIKEWLGRGINWIEVDVDYSLFLRSAKEIFEGTKKIFKEFLR